MNFESIKINVDDEIEENMDQYLNLTEYIKNLKKNDLYLFTEMVIFYDNNIYEQYSIAKEFLNFLIKYRGPIFKKDEYTAYEFKSKIESFISTSILVESNPNIDVFNHSVKITESEYIINLSKYILEASDNGIEIYINYKSNLIRIITKSKHFTTINNVELNSFAEKLKNILPRAIELDKGFSTLEEENCETVKTKDEHDDNILSYDKELILKKIIEKIEVFYEELQYFDYNDFDYNMDNNNILNIYEFFIELYEIISRKHFSSDDINNLRTKYNIDMNFIFLDLSCINSCIDTIRSIIINHLKDSIKYNIGIVFKNRLSKIKNELLIFHRLYNEKTN